MKLSIIIPQFKENERLIAKLLVSLERQLVKTGIFDVVIVNDASDILLSESFLSKFSIPIRYLKLKRNVGPGMCRQAGIESCQGEYIMFCDADDYLCRFDAIAQIVEVTEEQPEVIWCSWYTQLEDNTLRTMRLESTWLHGKVFRRQFLKENHIRFKPEFRTHEDTYFVGLAWELAKTKSFIDIPLYVYAYNRESITRINNGAYLYDELETFLKSSLALFTTLRIYNNKNVSKKAKQLNCYVSRLITGLQEPYLSSCRILLDKVNEFTH